MSVFTLDLSDDLRSKLEEHRKALGARSLAEAVRLLIEATSAPTEAVVSAAAVGALRELREKLVFRSDIPLGPIERKPGALLKGSKR